MKLLLVLFFLVSCSSTSVKIDDPVVHDDVENEISDTVEPSGPSLFLTVGKCTNCTDDQYKKIKDAVVKTNEVVASQCFRNVMESRPLIQTNDMSPSQVVNALIHGNITVDTEMYYTFKRVLGYTIENVHKIWLNRKYMMSWNICDLSSLLGHENSHKVGFGHDFKATSRRVNSVPYSVNAAFKECCQ